MTFFYQQCKSWKFKRYKYNDNFNDLSNWCSVFTSCNYHQGSSLGHNHGIHILHFWRRQEEHRLKPWGLRQRQRRGSFSPLQTCSALIGLHGWHTLCPWREGHPQLCWVCRSEVGHEEEQWWKQLDFSPHTCSLLLPALDGGLSQPLLYSWCLHQSG